MRHQRRSSGPSDSPPAHAPQAADERAEPQALPGQEEVRAEKVADGAAKRSPESAESAGPATGPNLVSRLLTRFLSMRGLVSFLASFTFHVALILLLALVVVWIPEREHRTLLVSKPSDEIGSTDDLQTHRITVGESAASDTASPLLPLESELLPDLPTDPLARRDSVAKTPIPSSQATEQEEAMRQPGTPQGGGVGGRSGKAKEQLLMEGGGTRESEEAVALGLAWLAAHQWQDGGWRLKFSDGPCQGTCRDEGKLETTTGATGLSLLAFLGAGHTHLQGEYRDVVHNGLYYLRNRMIMTPHGGDLQEGTMYAQGIATLALCEAYALTHDPELKEPAQRAVDFICYAQHSGGGWRYYPQMPGDTTVFGWQMMALKSASLAGLEVPSPVLMLAERFLDSVQSGGGAFYGYQERGNKPGPTAVGLLIRMYTGWLRGDERLQRGVDYLVKQGVSERDFYFDYYATLVLYHHGGNEWPAWNAKMRDYLVSTQVKEGHERGSWFLTEQHNTQGGRLYTTAICTMILEVYYRYMPLYGDAATDDFEL